MKKYPFPSSFIFHISFQSLGWTKCSQLKLKESCRDHYYLPDILLRSSALLHMLNEGYSRTVFSLLLINMGRLQSNSNVRPTKGEPMLSRYPHAIGTDWVTRLWDSLCTSTESGYLLIPSNEDRKSSLLALWMTYCSFEQKVEMHLPRNWTWAEQPRPWPSSPAPVIVTADFMPTGSQLA